MSRIPLVHPARRRGAPGAVVALGTALVLGTMLGCSDAGDAQQTTMPPSPAEASSPAASHGAPLGADDLHWVPVPEPMFPAGGAELAVLQGDPSVPGAVYTVRLRMPDGYTFPAHFHPEDEHVTAIQGRLLVGLGDVVDTSDVYATLQPGGFVTAPKGVHHWASARGSTVVQVHGLGPFQITYVDENGNSLPQ